MSYSKNYLQQIVFLVLFVVIALISLSFIPYSFTSYLGLRRIDILSDIRPPSIYDTLSEDLLVDLSSESIINDSLVVIDDFEDTCRIGLVCFQDFSVNHTGMKSFYDAIEQLSTLGRPVRIAFYGDSYIEGDILTADLRDSLQLLWGGGGVGMVGATSPTAGFRQTVKHTASGWKSYSLLDSSSINHVKMGIAGTYFVPKNNAWSQYIGVKRSRLDTVQRARILYRLPKGSTEFSYRINNLPIKKLTLAGGVGLRCVNIMDTVGIGSIQVNFPTMEGLHIYGISLEDSTGILVDNFSLRGIPGTTLKNIPQETLTEFDRVLGYDLIVLEYGLNAMSTNVTKYTRYKQDMCKTVQHFKEAFPNSSILLLSVGDRSKNSGGKYISMPEVPAMVSYQQAVCAETNIVFWNMFEAMGGAGSMTQLVTSKPPKANKDYTHLNFAGGKFLGGILFETIVYGKEQYDRRYKRQ